MGSSTDAAEVRPSSRLVRPDVTRPRLQRLPSPNTTERGIRPRRPAYRSGVPSEAVLVWAPARRRNTARVGAPTRQPETAWVGAPTRQPETARVGAPARQPETAWVGAPTRQPETAWVGAPTRQPETAWVGAPTRQPKKQPPTPGLEQPVPGEGPSGISNARAQSMMLSNSLGWKSWYGMCTKRAIMRPGTSVLTSTSTTPTSTTLSSMTWINEFERDTTAPGCAASR
jgi:hypothetical protein